VTVVLETFPSGEVWLLLLMVDIETDIVELICDYLIVPRQYLFNHEPFF
jgi:hypothetical protein